MFVVVKGVVIEWESTLLAEYMVARLCFVEIEGEEDFLLFSYLGLGNFVTLSGRNKVGVLFKGSRKTSVFLFTITMSDCRKDCIPILPSEGPFSIICSSRDRK